MNGNPYSRILQTMQQQGGKNNGQPMSVGCVATVNPLSVRYNNVVVTNGVCCRFPQMPETLKEAIGKDSSLQPELKDFLNGLYEAFNLLEGDNVIVQKAGNNLYILGKA